MTRAVTVVLTLAVLGGGTWLAHFLLTHEGCDWLGTWLYSACAVLLVARQVIDHQLEKHLPASPAAAPPQEER